MRLRRGALPFALAGAFVLAACSDAPDPVAPDPGAPAADRGAAPGGAAVDVIVALNPAFAPGGHAANQARAAGIARQLGAAATHTYGTALFGFAGSVPLGRLRALDRDPRVLYWERDQIASIPRPRASAPPWCPDNPDHPACAPDDGGDGGGGGQVTPWGVTRVGGPGAPTGTAWIIDTGIDLDHTDLNVDVARSVNFVARGKKSPDDGNGHGTHVAGTVGAIDDGADVVGVAAGATLVAVRVLDNSGSGTFSAVIAGVDHVAANASAGDVANMSLGGPASQAVDDAVTAAADAGVRFSLAAGNSSTDASGTSPARVEHSNVWTVSAVGQDDCLASFSNFGNPPVDFAAPGVGVLSTKKGGGTTTLSGTSMAAPHVGGLLLSGWNGQTSDGAACSDPDGNPDPIAHR